MRRCRSCKKAPIMKKILVPTDFSEVAANAYRFAQVLSERVGARTELLHAYHPSFDYANPYLDVPAVEFEQIKQELLQQFAEAYTDAQGGVAVLPKTQLNIGFAAEEIVRLSEGYDLIVMGTTGQGNLLERAFGSVSTHVARFAKCPVLLVPRQCKCQSIEQVVFASSHPEADAALLEPVLDIAGGDVKDVHFVHVEKQAHLPYHIGEAMHEKASYAGHPSLGIHAIEIECPDVQAGVIQYADEAGADMIVTGTVQRSFLDRLFHKSVTRQMAFHTEVPLLVMKLDA